MNDGRQIALVQAASSASPSETSTLIVDQREHWESIRSDNSEMFSAERSDSGRYAIQHFPNDGATQALELGAGQERDTFGLLRAGFKVYEPHYADVVVSGITVAAGPALIDQLTTSIHDVRAPLSFPNSTVDASYSDMLFTLALSTMQPKSLAGCCALEGSASTRSATSVMLSTVPGAHSATVSSTTAASSSTSSINSSSMTRALAWSRRLPSSKKAACLANYGGSPSAHHDRSDANRHFSISPSLHLSSNRKELIMTSDHTTNEVTRPVAHAIDGGVDLLLPPTTPREVLDIFIASCNIGACDCDTAFVARIASVELFVEPGRLRVRIAGDVTPEEVLAEMVNSAPELSTRA